MATIEAEHRMLLGYREGAHFGKMDLHTHSPASECSSFELPAALEAEIAPLRKALRTRAGRTRARELMSRLAARAPVLDQAFANPALQAMPWVAPRPELDRDKLALIAVAWLEDVQQLSDDDSVGLRKTLDGALRDVASHLASLVFPEEFVMRCYLEGLEIVALTDHNHPGYVVPRLPELGTWHGALERVNDCWHVDLRHPRRPGAEVRGRMLERLALARHRLEARGAVSPAVDRSTRAQHAEGRPKRLRSADDRLAHVRQLELTWASEDHLPSRLTLLPGTEITVSDVHLLAIFPPTWYVPGRIAGILGDIGESQWGRGFEAAASASVQTTLELVHEAGGIAIPAHANSDFKGLLRLFRDGLALGKVLTHPALVALETVGGPVLAGARGKRGKDPCETLRQLDRHQDKLLCFVKGSDAHECRLECDGTGEDLGARFTFVKADLRPNDTPAEVFRALRLALGSGHNRIVEFPTEDSYNYRGAPASYRVPAAVRTRLLHGRIGRPLVLGVAVSGTGSYADGLSVRFSPQLNTVIGSGGKSTLIRLIGYAFGIIRFRADTPQRWLPERVRAYWKEGGRTFCVERRGRNADPNAQSVAVRLAELMPGGGWIVRDEPREAIRTRLESKLAVWPAAEIGDDGAPLPEFEGDVIGDLVGQLETGVGGDDRPLLVVQRREFFDGERLFREVLGRPLLRDRQILWSTGSANVPSALDAEKVIVTIEKRRGRQMELACAGDLHEDEIRAQLLDCCEGGADAFRLRRTLYEL
jgi:hypothetical protein